MLTLEIDPGHISFPTLSIQNLDIISLLYAIFVQSCQLRISRLMAAALIEIQPWLLASQ